MAKRFLFLLTASFLAWALAAPVCPAWQQAGAADWGYFGVDDDDEDEGDDIDLGYEGDDGMGDEDDDGFNVWGEEPQPPRRQDRTAAPPARGGGQVDAAGTFKATWLSDPVIGVPLGRVITPGDWEATGHAVWNLRTAANPCVIALVMENPGRRLAMATVGVLAELEWVEAQVGNIRVGFNDGDINTDTGTIMRPYRNATRVLEEFLVPALVQGTPGMRRGPVRPVQDGVAESRKKAEQRAAILAQTNNRVTGIDAGAAEMRFEWTDPDGTAMEGRVMVSVHGVFYAAQMSTRTRWTIDVLHISAWPKGSPSPEEALQSRDGTVLWKLEMNPQWGELAGRVTREVQAKNRGVMEEIGRKSRETFRESQEVRYQLDEKFRRALLQQSVYEGPDGKTYLAPNTTNHALINRVTGEMVATEHEIPAGRVGPHWIPGRLIER